MEYMLWCDESIKRGPYFSNFYGGALLLSRDYEYVKNSLAKEMNMLNLNREVKWTKVTENYLNKYKELMELFFVFVKEDKIKVRIMFSQNSNKPDGLNEHQKDQEFFLLYYQFVKHAYGFGKISRLEKLTNLRIMFDTLPDKKEKKDIFKEHILNLNRLLIKKNISITKEGIQEVDSKKHHILQCLDVVLGAMAFRLNDHHKYKPKGQYRRGKRTLAKDKLYRHIYKLISEIHPRFNIGVSTSLGRSQGSNFDSPYSHWLFKPRQSILDPSKNKKPRASY